MYPRQEPDYLIQLRKNPKTHGCPQLRQQLLQRKGKKGYCFQCFGFATLIYEIISGKVAYTGSDDLYVEKKIELSDKDNIYKLLNTIPNGTHFRFQLSTYKHSIILANKTEEYVEIYHCNYPIDSEKYQDYYKQCLITFEKLTYEEFNNRFNYILFYNPTF